MMTRCPACDSTRLAASYMGRGVFETLRYEYLDCGDCGTIFVDPMPDAATLASMYAPEYADTHYGAELGGGSSSAEADWELDLALQWIVRESGGGRVLDVGCGAGRLLRAASARGVDIEGYEMVPSSAARTAQVTGLPVHSGRLAEAPGRYSVVHVADVLEHTPRPLEVLLEMRGLLAPGGRLLARGPLEAQPTLFRRVVRLQRRARARLGRLAPVTMPPWHLILYTLRGWHALLGRAGMATSEERTHEFHWPATEAFTAHPAWMVKRLSVLMSRTRAAGRLGLFDRTVSLAHVRMPAAG